uniref:Uncharacterized protein n=1 Tax=Oryza meridionalis TaxID=40149 RepID=A0A0E0CU85_9ORYZ
MHVWGIGTRTSVLQRGSGDSELVGDPRGTGLQERRSLMAVASWIGAKRRGGYWLRRYAT